MIGAIAGDVIGSVYESRHNRIKTTDFPLFSPRSNFTDDTVMTLAVADAILEHKDYAATMKTLGRQHPHAGYGSKFKEWLFQEEAQPYDSWGNGSAMRVSPVGFAYDNVDEVLLEAKRSAVVSHNHPEGIKGAQATALAIHLAYTGSSKEAIKAEIVERFDYDLDRRLDDIRPGYRFDVACQGSVPESIISFLEASNYEDTIRNAISLGGDSDTQACIAGGIAQAFYKEIPSEIINKVRSLLPDNFLQVIDRFDQTYNL
ncbi:MAG: ADP-ribosylglycohydrolase family protein [Pseudomonadales bacterium]